MSDEKKPPLQQTPVRLGSTRELQRLLLPVQREALEGMGVDFAALEMRAAAEEHEQRVRTYRSLPSNLILKILKTSPFEVHKLAARAVLAERGVTVLEVVP